jgi:hypothetical protein
MNRSDDFDAFYKETRSRLLLQTYALTGDLPAARSAVRDTFVVAWHLWPKLSRAPDPENWARPHAWSQAQRRHTARIWHRDRGLDTDARATLEALGKLRVTERKALLLAQLASVSMTDLARELGLPRAEAEQVLQTATAHFAVNRDVASTHIRPLFEPLREQTEQATWPRPSILRRAGSARRRRHTLVGVAIAVAAVVVSGSLVTDAAGVRPTLTGGKSATPSAPAESHHTPPPEPPEEFAEADLITADQVADHVRGRHWTETDTTDNTAGNGRVMPCQSARYADPRGVAALFREFETSPAKGRPEVAAVEGAEVSRKRRAAHRAFETSRDWFAGCTEPRAQLLTTHRVDGVADEAMLLQLRVWGKPTWSYVAGVARSGRYTTTTVTRTTDEGPADLPQSARLLATAVRGVCDEPHAGACPTKPRITPVPPVPVGEMPGMIAEVDLPPIEGVERPWVGTEPHRAMDNDAATSCDDADFRAEPMTNNVTRTFVIPRGHLADQFGLTETVGTMPVRRAKAFVQEIRQRMVACPDKDLGTDVKQVQNVTGPKRELTVWHVTTELSDDASVSFLMGILRNGTAIGQVGFVPDAKVTMAPGAFIELVERAADRLPSMPPPG